MPCETLTETDGAVG